MFERKVLSKIVITILMCGFMTGRTNADTMKTQKQIKILPLGDSITYGTTRETGKPEFHGGYRAFLEKLLTAEYGADSFQFIGIYDTGSADMRYPKHMGKRGIAIDEIISAQGGIAAKLKESGIPDVILLMAGTNDLGRQKETPEKAFSEMKDLLQALRTNAPDAWILVAQIPPNRNKNRHASTKQLNAMLVPYVKQLSEKDKKIAVVDIFSVVENTQEGLPDGTHPNQKNYEKMANAWFEAIQKLPVMKK